MDNYNIDEINDDAFTSNMFKHSTRNLSSEINDFQVIYIPQNETVSAGESVSESSSDSISDKNEPNTKVFHSNSKINTFVIWEQAYQENEGLFLNLRLAARNELIIRIGENIVGYLMGKYESSNKSSIKEKAKLTDKMFINQLKEKVYLILKEDTFLGDNRIWEDFCSWFRSHLTDWILEDMEKKIGVYEMHKFNKSELNEAFYKYITGNFSKDATFMERFTKIINEYTEVLIEKIIKLMDRDTFSIEKIKELFGLEGGDFSMAPPKYVGEKDITYTLIDQGNLLVMSNAPYQSVREVLSKRKFESCNHTPWPTAKIKKGTIEGMVQIIPYSPNQMNLAVDKEAVKEVWKQSEELSELDVDIFDALSAIFLAKARHRTDYVIIHLDDLLVMRGLKPKLGGSGRRGGYEINQRRQVLKALSKIQSIWIDLEKATVYKKGRAVQLKLQGRSFIFKDLNDNECFIGAQLYEKQFKFTVDSVFSQYLHGSGRQVALLPIQALQYNPYQQSWEKKIIRYLSWRWRTQARKSDYLQPHKISTLLNMIGIDMNERTPSRTRDRLEQAFETLLEDGVIASWHYEKWDESIASNHGWTCIWRNSTMIIEPTQLIKRHYRPLERNQNVERPFSTRQVSPSEQSELGNIGVRIRAVRKNFKFTLLQVSEELDISISYLSNIERGIKTPSSKILLRLMNWLELYEPNLN